MNLPGSARVLTLHLLAAALFAGLGARANEAETDLPLEERPLPQAPIAQDKPEEARDPWEGTGLRESLERAWRLLTMDEPEWEALQALRACESFLH